MKFCKSIFLYFTKLKKSGDNQFRLLSICQPHQNKEKLGMRN